MRPQRVLPMLLVFAVIVISGCVQTPGDKTSPTKPTAYQNELYSLERPASWEVEEHDSFGQDSFVYFKASQEGDSSLLESDPNSLQENVVVYVSPLEDPEQDLIHFFQDSVEILMATTPSFAVVDHGEASFGDVPAYKIIYTEGEEALKYLQVFAVYGGNSHILTYTSPAETFDKYLPEAEAIISSYTITNS